MQPAPHRAGWRRVAFGMSQTLGPIAAQRARNAQLLAEARVIAERDVVCGQSGADIAVPEEGAPPRRAPLPVVLLPANTFEMVPLPDADRQAFLKQLRGTLEVVFRDPVRNNARPMSAMAEAARMDAVGAEDGSGDRAESAENRWRSSVLGASCATCRGECCTAGGTHAFLRAESLLRVRAQLVSDGASPTPDTLEAAYAAYLPEHHYHASCVFHTPRGCTLPRAMRSDLCNRYLCGSLTQLTRALESTGHQAAYVAAADTVQLQRMSHVSAAGVRPLPVTPPADQSC